MFVFNSIFQKNISFLPHPASPRRGVFTLTKSLYRSTFFKPHKFISFLFFFSIFPYREGLGVGSNASTNFTRALANSSVNATTYLSVSAAFLSPALQQSRSKHGYLRHQNIKS
jgi:hypothetical protein